MRRWLAALLLFGCTEEPTVEAEPIVVPPVALRADAPVAVPVRSFTDEAVRAEVRQGGLLVDLGTPEQGKWLEAWAETGWSTSRVSHGAAAIAAERRATLTVPDWQGGATELRVRARGDAEQDLEVAIDGRRLGAEAIGADWATLVYPLPEPLAPGTHRLELSFAKGGAEVDWVWLATGARAAPDLARVRTARYGRPLQALVADPPRRYSYHLQIPDAATLAFAYAGDPKAGFRVEIAADGNAPAALFSGAGGDAGWRRERVELGRWAGRMVRLDFVSEGEGRADWGAPELLSAAASADPPPPVLPGDYAENLVYVLVDTARADAYRPFEPDSVVQTPNLDRFAAASAVFSAAYANAPWTKPSVATLLTSLLPTTHGTKAQHAKVPEALTLVSEHLQARGFKTGLVSANTFVSPTYGFGQGWDYEINLARGVGRSLGKNVFEHAEGFLDRVKEGERFFLYVQTIDPHVPYHVPGVDLHKYYEGRYEGRLGEVVSGEEHQAFNEGELSLDDDDRAYLTACYRAEVTYNDRYFGRFLEALERRGLKDDTVIVFSNDHGEELFDRGRLGHGHTLYDELIRSPLVIHYPRLVPATRVEETVSLVDVMPTALELLGVPALPEAQGMSLWGAIHGRPSYRPGTAVAELQDHTRSIRVGRYKLIVNGKEGTEEIYDLAEDPKELRPLEGVPVLRRTLGLYLREAFVSPQKSARLSLSGGARRYRADDAQVDDEMIEHLEALGYVGG